MPNYHITNYVEDEFDAHKFFIDGKSSVIEGAKTEIIYKHNSWQDKSVNKPTRLQILRNYSNAIVKAGGEIVFERYNSEYGHYTFKDPEANEIWVEVKSNSSSTIYEITIIVVKAMRQDIVIDAELIKNTIELQGKISIYGILFDVGKAVIKEESKEALDQIAKYLKDNPTVNCWVVGHTDADGSFAVNSQLSLDRAKSVKASLEKKYSISANRLFAEGVGPLALVSTNSTEAGKKLNRRVELVKKQCCI